MIIAIDFDGTIVTHEYPQIGKPVPYAISIMKDFVKQGCKIILHTMRSGKELKEAVDYISKQGITLYGINHNPTQDGWTTSPKTYANLYIDDAAVGCPLIYSTNIEGFPEPSRPYVDWIEIKKHVAEILERVKMEKHSTERIKRIIRHQEKMFKENSRKQNLETDKLNKRLEEEFNSNTTCCKCKKQFKLNSDVKVSICQQCLDKEITMFSEPGQSYEDAQKSRRKQIEKQYNETQSKYSYHVCEVTPGIYNNEYRMLVKYDNLVDAETVLKVLKKVDDCFTVYEIKKIEWINPVTIISDSVENNLPIIEDYGNNLTSGIFGDKIIDSPMAHTSNAQRENELEIRQKIKEEVELFQNATFKNKN